MEVVQTPLCIQQMGWWQELCLWQSILINMTSVGTQPPPGSAWPWWLVQEGLLGF